MRTYGREREGVDRFALRLTAYAIKNIGNARQGISYGDPVKLQSASDTGSGQVQDKARIALFELICRVNDLFEGVPTHLAVPSPPPRACSKGPC